MARFSTAFGLCLFFLSFPSRSPSLWRTWGPRQASPLDTTILKSAVVFLTSEAFQLLSVRCGSAQGISRGSLPRSCWTVPTGRLDRPINVITLPIVAAFVMTQWDLVIDPPESTISKAWIWHDGGADFGVPLSN